MVLIYEAVGLYELSVGTKTGEMSKWPWTANERALILRYFTEFGSFRGALRKSGRQSHNYFIWTIYDYYV